MNAPPSSTQRMRLGEFDIDLRAGELYKRGRRIKLQGKPFQLLAALLEQPGELVTREELREKLWSADTFVDFDGSLNAAVNRLREALGDSADHPRFVETLPRRGYRLIAPVEVSAAEEASSEGALPSQDASARRPPRRTVAVALGIVACLLSFVFIWSPDGSGGVESEPPKDRIMIGVLPLDDYGADANQQILSQALTDELITELGRQSPERLGVIASASMRAYHRQQRPIGQIGSELGIDYVVEGGVRRTPEGAKITIRLVDVRTQAPVWSDDFGEELERFADVEREAARLISEALALQLLPMDARPVDTRSEVSSAAYELYLKGRYFREQLTEEGFRKGLEYFGRAIDEDPSYARAYAGLAGCYCLLGGHGIEVEPPAETLTRAEEAARQALEIDSSLAEAHAALGMINLKYRWDLPEAKRRFERAVSLNPSYAQAHLWYSLYYEVLGMEESAVESALKARELDPLSIPAMVNLAHQYRRAGRYDDAVASLREAIELDPRSGTARWALGDCHVSSGRLQEAVGELSEAVRLSDGNPAILASLGYAHGRNSDVDAARSILERLQQLSAGRYISPVNMALVALGLGDAEEALAQLQLGYEQRSRSMVWLNVDERFEPLHHDKRFQQILVGIGVPRAASR